MKKTQLVLFTIIALIIVLTAIFTLTKHSKTKNGSQQAELIQNRIEHKSDLMRKLFIGEKLEFLPNITNDSLIYYNNRIIVYYYTNSDCFSCINDGFEICDELNLISGQVIINTISTSLTSYRPNSYIDNEKLFQNKLTSTYSPTFFVFDTNLVINDVYLCDSNNENNIPNGIKFIKQFIQ